MKIRTKYGEFATPCKALTPIGFPTLGRRADSLIGVGSRTVPAASPIEATAATQTTHRHRLVRGFPSGKSRSTKSRRPKAPFPVLLRTEPGQRTQPLGGTPVSRARIAMLTPNAEAAAEAARASSIHPMGFLGRRDATSAPRAQSVTAGRTPESASNR